MAKIKVENIVKTFNRHSRNANNVLKGVSFELPEKGLVCIFGKSGSGKTTLLNIIGGLEKADGGKVYIDGECTNGRQDKIRNAKIGFIFQNYYLEKGTIAEILRNQMTIAGFKDEKEIAYRTEEALKLVDMERFKNKRGDALSGGQQQRVAIARAIVKGGDIILADEPTGNLDAENTVKVMDILKEISKTRLVVVVTHEVSLIQRYADSHIKIVDGELVEDGEIDETELAPSTYADMYGEGVKYGVLSSFAKSTAKHNGRLFTLKNIFRTLKGEGEEKIYSTGNIFKQIFILALAVVMCFFAFTVYETISTVTENKTLGENSIYTNINAYSTLRRLDDSVYEKIDFFDMNMREGSFSFGGLASLSGISATYAPRALDQNEQAEIVYGSAPEDGEVLVTRALAEEIKRQFRLSELQDDRAMLLVVFDNTYRVSGIAAGEEKLIYFNKVDYVNFLGVYNSIGFSDINGLLFKDSFGATAYTAEILLSQTELADDMARIEINRNSLYKMMADTTQADYELEKTNSQLKRTPYAIQLTGSKMYVEKYEITRDVMTTDIRVYVNGEVLKNIFVYISPNLDALSSESAKCYFEIQTAGGEQLVSLKAQLKDRGVTAVNIAAAYEQENREALQSAASGLYIFVVVIVLLLLIFFFIEKSGSIKNSKEYGIYRAIGVNKSNLLFKETLLALTNNIVGYFVFSLVTGILICARYAVMNVAFGGFIGIAVALFIVSALLMVGISLIPYLFVLTKTPSQILSRYDI